MEKIDVLGHLMLPTIVTGIMIFTTHKSSENWKGERKVVSIKCKNWSTGNNLYPY